MPEAPLPRFLERLEAAVRDGSLTRLILTSPRAGAPAGLQRVHARLVELRGATVLSCTWRFERRDETRNVAAGDVRTEAQAWLPALFRSALLGTSAGDWQLSLPDDGAARLIRHKPAAAGDAGRAHDRAPQRILDPRAAPFLRALGIADARGTVLPSQQAKFRQVAQYVEILDDLVDDLGWKAGRPVQAVDMGCGRGVLTFAAWHLLRNLRGLDAHVTGVEERAELAEAADAHARTLGCTGLRFAAGRIADVPLDGAHVVIALHACNTATDDALARGIAAGADLILAAPCCHHEVRPQLDRAGGAPGPALAAVLRHGLLRERFAEWLTDGLRALHLEAAGYDTRVLEFVAAEHTPRNLLLAAIRRERPVGPGPLQDAIAALKRAFGVERQSLDGLLQPRPA